MVVLAVAGLILLLGRVMLLLQLQLLLVLLLGEIAVEIDEVRRSWCAASYRVTVAPATRRDRLLTVLI